MPALKRIVELRQAREAHHRSDGPDKGSNSRGRRTIKKSLKLVLTVLVIFLRNKLNGLKFKKLENLTWISKFILLRRDERRLFKWLSSVKTSAFNEYWRQKIYFFHIKMVQLFYKKNLNDSILPTKKMQ